MTTSREHRRFGARLRHSSGEPSGWFGRRGRSQPSEENTSAVLPLGQWYKLVCPECGQSGLYYGSGASVNIWCACGQGLFHAQWHRHRVNWSIWCPICLVLHDHWDRRSAFPLGGNIDSYVVECERTGAGVGIIGNRETTLGATLALISARSLALSAKSARSRSPNPGI